MSLFTKKFVYLIDSNQRISGTSSNFTIAIPIPIGNKYNRIIVSNAIIPKSYYLIRNGFNTFQILENGVSKVIILNIGNYSLSEFTLELIRALSVGTLFTYDVVFSSRLGKFTYTVSNNLGSQPTFIFTTNVYEQLGFYVNSSNTFNTNTLTSTCVINLNPNEMIFICSDLVNNAEGGILEVIPMASSCDFSFVYYQATSTHQIKELTNRNNQTFNFRITDSRYNVLDLNGKEVSITICIHEEDDTNMLIKENILIKNSEKLNRRLQQTTTTTAEVSVPIQAVDGVSNPTSINPPAVEIPDPNIIDISNIQTTTNLDASDYTVGFL